jgi:hypothetical protein
MQIGNTAYNLDISWQCCVCVVIDRKDAGYAAERGDDSIGKPSPGTVTCSVIGSDAFN